MPTDNEGRKGRTTVQNTNRIGLDNPELRALRIAFARNRTPELEAEYLRKLAAHVRAQADEFDRRADAVLSA
jgi:hypothetical protein